MGEYPDWNFETGRCQALPGDFTKVAEGQDSILEDGIMEASARASRRGLRSFGISFRADWHHAELGVSASDSGSQRAHDSEGEERCLLN